MPEMSELSDKAIAVFAFAAYHQLGSGQPVKSVVRSDGKGHSADDAAVSELEALGLATPTEADIAFTEDGLRILNQAISGLTSAARES